MKALRLLLRPIGAWLYRHTPAGEAIRTMQTQVAELADQLPVLRNTIESQNAVAREWRRAELRLTHELAELRAQVAGPQPSRAASNGAGRQRPQAPEDGRLGGGGALLLHLGPGDPPSSDYVRVSTDPGPDVDVVAGLGELPFDAGTVTHLDCGRVFELARVEELCRGLLPHWLSLLRPGGRLTAVVSDAEASIAAFGAGRLSFEQLREGIFGRAGLDRRDRASMHSKRSLETLLTGTGFAEVSVSESGDGDLRLEARSPRTRAVDPRSLTAARGSADPPS